MELFWALAGSKWVRRLAACFVVVGAYAIWESRVEKRGAERVIVKIETKANADAKTATEVRAADGKGGRADPYVRRP